MKKLRVFPKSIASIIVLLLCITVQTNFSQGTFSINESPLPAPTEPVNDFAGVIDDVVEQQINQKIKDFKAKYNPPVVLAVAVVKTTGERDIFEYSLAVARGWKIGTKDDDNPTALLFIAVDDRKYFTQISKDLQDELPDALVGQLQRQNLVPAFKQGDYTKGVNDTIDAYIRTIEAKQTGAAVPTPAPVGKTQPQQSKRSSFSLCGVMPCLIILFILMIALFSRAGRRKNKNDNNRWGGGGFGGGGGSVLPWIIGSAIANSIGNSSSSGWSSGGSSSDWGGGSSGGSDWGGFGGGGDFDGGGAGGDW